MAGKLKYLDLSRCSLKDTYFLSAFKKLEVLILKSCWRLKRIDASIGKLKALQQLNLCNTRSLFALPDSIGSLENLEILDISQSSIEELPTGIGSLRNLRELHASNCDKLKRIMVERMCNLSSLRHLNFAGCKELQSLPVLPSGLTELHFTCRSLPLLSHLTHLKRLRVWD